MDSETDLREQAYAKWLSSPGFCELGMDDEYYHDELRAVFDMAYTLGCENAFRITIKAIEKYLDSGGTVK